MKALLMGFALAGMALGQGQAARPAAAKTAVKTVPAKSAAGLTLPASAKKTGEGVWEHTDAAGKQWVYKQMPFGLTRMTRSELDVRTAGGATLPEGMSVTEENGGYKFTRATPFGGVTYTKKEDELTETERAVIAARARRTAAAAVTAQK